MTLPGHAKLISNLQQYLTSNYGARPNYLLLTTVDDLILEFGAEYLLDGILQVVRVRYSHNEWPTLVLFD